MTRLPIALAMLLSLCTITSASFAQEKNMGKSRKENAIATFARKAFDAWAKGENTGDYSGFKTLLTDKFHHFSHPLEGKFTGAEALQKIQNLIAQREKVSNQLTFSQVKTMRNDHEFVFAFDSEGKVAGGYPYKGFNIIALRFEEGILISFAEYFGLIDPSWFKN